MKGLEKSQPLRAYDFVTAVANGIVGVEWVTASTGVHKGYSNAGGGGGHLGGSVS